MTYETGRRIPYNTGSLLPSLQQQVDSKAVEHHVATYQNDMSWRQRLALAKAMLEKLIKGLDNTCDDDYAGLLNDAELSLWECGEIYDEEQFAFNNQRREVG